MKANLIILALSLLALPSRWSQAGPVGQLTTFTGGTQAKASEVNGNFNTVSTAVNDNDTRIGAIEAHVTPAGNIVLGTSTANAGNILKGTVPFIHNFGTSNTFIGVGAGNLNMTGDTNTAGGHSALFSNTTGSDNTATGASALSANTTGFNNTASGANALLFNTIGTSNTASGQSALFHNTTGGSNVATGVSALQNNTDGANNTASGTFALSGNTSGSLNTASGFQSLQKNTVGTFNTASGASALLNNTTGINNIGIGNNAGLNLTTGDNNIDIGNLGVAAEANTIRIGAFGTQNRAFIIGIRGITTGTADAIPVLIDSSGQIGTTNSSRHVKDDIADMGNASSTLMKLRPVTFHYKSDKNPKARTLQYGLVAEEVDRVAPGLVARSADGKIETVYYQFLAPMLLNEVQKQQRTIAAQTARIATLEKQGSEIAELKAQVARMSALLARLDRREKVAAAGR